MLIRGDVLTLNGGRGWILPDGDDRMIEVPAEFLTGQDFDDWRQRACLVREPWRRYLWRRLLVRTWPVRRAYRILRYGHPHGKRHHATLPD